MRHSVKPFLLGGVAATAVTVACFAAAPAAAQCVTSGSTVTCNGATTDGQAQQAISGATPPDLTFNVNGGATIASVQRQILVPNTAGPVFAPPNGFVNLPAFTGAVTVNNAGVIGTSALQGTNLLVAGASRFTGVNSGVINGSVIVGSLFGGSTAGSGSFANSGTVTGAISLQGSGDQSYAGRGVIQGAPSAYTGLTLASRATTTTTAPDGTQTTTVTGGMANAAVEGYLRSTNVRPSFVGVSVTGVGGATATIGGTTGGVMVNALDANTVSRNIYSYQGGNSASTNVNNSQAVGGTATLTVNAGATVNGISSVTGLTSAAGIVNGAMSSGDQLYGSPLLTVTANAADTTYSNAQNYGFGATFSSSNQGASTSTSRGGTASLIVGTGATVAGGISVTGGSTASAIVNGTLSSTSPYSSNLAVTVGATDSVSNYASRYDATGGFSTSSGSTIQRGGAASATVGATGSVAGAVQVTGIINASATVAGAVGTAQTPGGVSVVAQGSDTSSSYSSSSAATGSNSTSTSTNNTTSRAGSASAAVTATARVAGSVGVSGGTSATATIDGAVGSASNPFGGVSVYAGGIDGTTTTTNTNSANGGSSSQTQDNSFSARGGVATVTVSATGSVIGSVSASSNRGPATATLSGRAGVANAQGYSPAPSLSAIASGVDTRYTSTSGLNRSAYSNSSTAVGGQATATVLAGGVMSGDVVATGDAGATLTNAGSVSGALRAAAGAGNTVNSNDSTGSVTTSGGVTTSTNQSNSANTSTPVATDATVTNTGAAGSVAATATGNTNFRSDGTVAGGVALAATVSQTSSTQSNQSIYTSTPATGGGATTVSANTSTSSITSKSVGGNVVATYNGTVGTNPTDPRQAQRTEITQTADGASTATLAGVVFANVTSSTGGATTSTANSSADTVTTQPLVGAGTATATETTVVSNRSSRTATGGPSSVVVTGAVRNNGAGTGNVTVQAAIGAASATVNAGVIEGALLVNAGAGQNTTTSLDATTTSTRAASTNFYPPFVQQSAATTSSTSTQLAGGTAAAMLTGARVGSVRVAGVGTGAGSAAATASVDAASTVGAFTVAAGGTDTRTDQTDTIANGVRTIVTAQVNTVSSLAGDARADVAGQIGGAAGVTSQGGAATLNLTGIAADTVSITANASDRTTTTTQGYAVTSPQGFTFYRQTSQTVSSTTTARGGVATLAISGASQAGGANAVGGAVTIDGFGGSVLTIAAGSRLLTRDAGVRVVGTAANATASTISSFDPTTGVFTGSTTRQTFTPVAGPASLTNAGVIGVPTTYFTTAIPVRVQSVGGATVTNSSQIYGDVAAAGFGERRDVTTVLTSALGTTPQTSVATTTYTPVTGSARIANTGVISGRAEVSGRTGTITNAGVIRGVAQLGVGVRNYTNTVTSTTAFDANGNLVTTSVTSPATPPSALFAQNLTLDQNGLLLGGVRVAGATTADPITGAPIRTSTITATVNLNEGSITLGDVTGQQGASGRLTRTAVNLTGNGFLGVGPTLQQAVQGVSFTAAPNYAAFAAIDPALGTAGAGGFTPAVALASGSRISGVDSVTKTGGGVFTVVGAPLLRGTGSPTFTIDAPFVRVASGELQLGVAGVDPATGQGVFSVNGEVQNDGTLVVGRRIASGALSGVQGVTLSVTGNVTQGTGGTLVLAASPTPALQTASSLTTTSSFLSVDGALSLAGVVNIAAPQGIYLSGRGPDIASVGGAFTSTASVNAFASPFVNFGLVTRTEGGRTIVTLNVTRTPYASVAGSGNATAAAEALQAAIPAAITAGAGSDLATVIVGLDTGGAGRAAGALDELGQASFYGSLAAISTTRPFGEVTDALASIDTNPVRPVSLWARIGGSTARTRGDASTGARQLTADGYGAIVGLAVTGGGVSAGIGVGPGWTDASAGIGRARANGWMLGGYAASRIGALSLAGQAVAGWSSWTASRNLQSFGRFATASFDGREIRLNGRAAFDLSMGALTLSPFAGLEWRQWRFNGFSERNAGALGITSSRASKSILSPELGARVSENIGALRAFVEGSYVFQPDIGSARAFSLVGAPVGFVAQGVTPGNFGRVGTGLETDVGRGTVFVRGDLWAGGGNRLGAVRVGARVRF